MCNSAVPSQCHVYMLGNERKHNHSKILLLNQERQFGEAANRIHTANFWWNFATEMGSPIINLSGSKRLGRSWRGREREKMVNV